MNLKRIYCNGSSLSAGGGLYENGVKEKYKEYYNLEWKDEKDVTYAKSYSPNNNPYPHNIFQGNIESQVKQYLDSFHNPIVYTNKFKGELLGLFSFLDKIGATYYYMFDNPTLKSHDIIYNELDKQHQLVIEDGVYTTSHFCHKHKLTIKDDTKGFTEDTHPGYWGYKKFSEIAIKFLEPRITPSIL